MSSRTVKGLPPLHDLISNIGKNDYCALFFIGATGDIIDILDGREQRFRIRQTAQKDFRFWNSLVCSLFMERSREEDITLLFDNLDRCSCPMGIPGVSEAHLKGRVWKARDIWSTVETQRLSQTLVQHFFRLLAAVLDQAHIRSVAKGISKIWPTSPNDLMPFGPETLLYGLILWKHLIPDMVIFKVAAQYIRFCGALVLPAFVNSEFTSDVIKFGRGFCDGAWKLALRSKMKTPATTFSHCFYLQAEPLVAYFSTVLDDHTYQTQLDMLHDCEVKSIQLFSILAYLASDDRIAVLPRSRAFLVEVQEIGARLYQLVERCFIRLPEIPIFPGIFAIAGPHLAQKDAARSEIEHTMCTNFIA
jgi:hypothetical protein